MEKRVFLGFFLVGFFVLFLCVGGGLRVERSFRVFSLLVFRMAFSSFLVMVLHGFYRKE